jgi:hypothetical protein
MTSLQQLAANPSEWALNDFFDLYGTHAITSLSMGAKFVAKATFDRTIEKSFESEGWDVSFSAEAGGFGYTASAGVSATGMESSAATASTDI